MKFKCIEIEKPTSRFTVGKIYESDKDGFITNDKGGKNWMSKYGMNMPIFIGEETRKDKKGKPYINPLFAHFERIIE